MVSRDVITYVFNWKQNITRSHKMFLNNNDDFINGIYIKCLFSFIN